jgi:hypothetical protein
MRLLWWDSRRVARLQDAALFRACGFNLHWTFYTKKGVRHLAVMVPRNTLARANSQDRCPELVNFSDNLACFYFVMLFHRLTSVPIVSVHQRKYGSIILSIHRST